MNKKVVISCGPIPAKLDSVKFLTNRFKGGLAFKTARILKETGFEMTIVKWRFTELPDNLKDCTVIDVSDVFEYYKWFEENAGNYDAFIMAAAVANLTPSEPYDGKFPSHNYKVGERFNIEFEIAPRAIDVIKQKNKRCCLIGYKLFDAHSDNELIEIAKHTRNDSKANIIFANTPKEAKTRKIALFQDNTTLTVDFDEHVELIKRAINQSYFKTEIVKEPEEDRNKIDLAKRMIEKFEETIEGYGTIAIKISDIGDFVTTSRGHKDGAVYVKEVKTDDNDVPVIYASEKATLNAPLLAKYIKDYDYVIHRHEEIFGLDNKLDKYVFPGTLEEYQMYDGLKGDKSVYELGHGYVKGYCFKEVDWTHYSELFPSHYQKLNREMEELIRGCSKESILEVGCNVKTDAGYFIDPNIDVIEESQKITYDDLKYGTYQFKLIILKNSINYLSMDEIKLLQDSLTDDGELIANTFNRNPEVRLKEYENGDFEAVYADDRLISHYLIKGEDEVYSHVFYKTEVDKLKELDFEIKQYGKNSLICYYKKGSK